MEWNGGRFLASALTLLAWITLFDSPEPLTRFLRTDVVIGLLWGTRRESTSFGIIASDESTAARTILYDGYLCARVWYATAEYCGRSVTDNIIQLNDYYCLRWDKHALEFLICW